jgi:hypothetical protein
VTIQAGMARRTELQVVAFRYLQATVVLSKRPVWVLAKLKEMYPQHVVERHRHEAGGVLHQRATAVHVLNTIGTQYNELCWMSM